MAIHAGEPQTWIAALLSLRGAQRRGNRNDEVWYGLPRCCHCEERSDAAIAMTASAAVHVLRGPWIATLRDDEG